MDELLLRVGIVHSSVYSATDSNIASLASISIRLAFQDGLLWRGRSITEGFGTSLSRPSDCPPPDSKMPYTGMTLQHIASAWHEAQGTLARPDVHIRAGVESGVWRGSASVCLF